MKVSGHSNPLNNRKSHDDMPSPAAYRLLAEICGGVAAAIGFLALAGWLLEMPRLASLGQELIPMAPSTATLFIACGAGIFLACRAAGDRGAALLARSFFGFGALISLVLFSLSIQGVYLDVEHFGIKAMGAIDGSPVGHMSPITASSFVLVSLSFIAVTSIRPVKAWRAIAVWWISVILTAVYVMLMLAYLFGTPMFYGGTFIPPAVTTSLAFFALGVALAAYSRPLAWPDAGRHDLGERYFSHTLIVVFIMMVAGVLSAGYYYHHKSEKQYQSEIERQLSAVADLKVSELKLWREERMADAELFYQNAEFSRLVKAVLVRRDSGDDLRRLKVWLGRLQSDRNYNGIFLLDASGSDRNILPGIASYPVSLHVRRNALESLHAGHVTFSDFYRSEPHGKIFLCLLVPLFDPEQVHTPLGVLVMRIDPGKYLYPFIQRWPNSSSTAETLLIRREGNDVVFLNELRFQKESALNLHIALDKIETPAVMAVLGQEGVVHGIDYRGHPVLAALRKIPDSPWYMVSRMDSEEIYAPLRERQRITVLLVCAMLVSAASGVGFVWRQQSSRFYRDKYETELKRVVLEERLAKISASVPGVIFQCQVSPDDNACLTYASSGLMPLYGIRPEDVLRNLSPLLAAIHPDDAAAVTDSVMASAHTLSPWHNEHRVLHPERGTIWVEGNATPELRGDGSVLLHGFLTDITERKEKEREIEIKNSELERFTYTVSHDLKSPLVTIKTFLGYLEEDLRYSDSSRVHQDMGFMHTAADKMSQLLAELLELSRVGRLNNPPQEIAFMDLAREAVTLDAGRISARGVSVEIRESPVVLIGDHPRLVEVWQNLVENACKFMGNQEHPRIEIGVDDTGREARFYVRDNGIGINPRFHAKVFGLFEKLEASGEGTGLGLALVKRIVEMYDGTIRVESGGEGLGTTFVFTLPAALKK